LRGELDMHEILNTRGLKRVLKSFLRREEGASVLEFALLSPLAAGAILVLGLLILQIGHRIKMDQIVRAGAAIAITDPGQEAVLERMRAAALNKGYIPGPVAGPDILVIQSVRTCFCPGQNMDMNCDQICPGQRPTVARYTLSALFIDAWTMGVNNRLRALRFPQVAFANPFVNTQVTVR
jgi:Flp pilus assembly pilin Flp